MRKIILLVAFLVIAIGYSQQENDLSTWAANNPQQIQQQNSEVEALIVKPGNHPLLIAENLQGDRQQNNNVQNVNKYLEITPIISGDNSHLFAEEDELLAYQNTVREVEDNSMNDLLDRFNNIGIKVADIGSYFTMDELYQLKRHFSSVNRDPMADIIPTAGATETFNPNVGDHFFDRYQPNGFEVCVPGAINHTHPARANYFLDLVAVLDQVASIKLMKRAF